MCARRGKAGAFPLLGLPTSMWKDRDGKVSDRATDPTGADAEKATRGENRAQATSASAHPRAGQVAAQCCQWTLCVLRSAHERSIVGSLSQPGDTTVASGAASPKPARSDELAAHAAACRPLDPSSTRRSLQWNGLTSATIYHGLPSTTTKVWSDSRIVLLGGAPSSSRFASSGSDSSEVILEP